MGSTHRTSQRSAAALRREVARSVDAPATLLPHFAELFRGMPNLGSQPRRVATMLDRAGIGPRSRILDLACGKGTLAITFARRFGCHITAVDGCTPFIEEALRAADHAEVSDLTTFIESDLRRFVSRANRPRARFDAALMMGLWALPDARRALRPLVRSRGIYVIDDVFRDERLTTQQPEFADIPTRTESLAILEQEGDRVIEVDVLAPSRLRALNDSLYRPLAANARRLAKAHPRLRPALATFLANQRDANQLLGRELRPAVWIVRRP
jgi:SAM-dependent methyltransferase